MEMDIPAGEGAAPRQSRKRQRTPASCGHCRIRKLKCSRTYPCDACVKSGDSSTCAYVSRDSERPPSNNLTLEESKNDALTARIDRLEELLLSAMQNDAQNAEFTPPRTISDGISPGKSRQFEKPNVDSGTEKMTEAFGVMKVDNTKNQTFYLGGTHWVSVMCEIEEFRSYLQENETEIEEKALRNRALISKAEGNSASLLHGTDPPVSREYLLSQLPPKSVTDKLVAVFLQTHKSTFHIVHEPTFRKQYEEHWRNPAGTSTMWLPLLFAILHHAEVDIDASEILSTGQGGQPQYVGQYKHLLIQSLIAGDYTNPVISTIQALVLYIEGEWLKSQDSRLEASLVLNLTVRLAIGMGLHRDSVSHPGITVFQGEIRRRIWAQIHQMDILQSFWLSLPPNIYQGDCDCVLPRNLLDTDFGEDTMELPPSRPLNEDTEVSYTVSKFRLCQALGKVARFTQSRSEFDVDGIFKRQNELDEARNLVPPHLRVDRGSMDTEPLDRIHQRIGLDRLYHASKCILYRKFLPLARRDSAFMQYRDSCIDAAMTLLNHQSTIILETESSYPQNVRKRHMYTLTTHDFFIAGMVIVLDIHYGLEIQPAVPILEDATAWGRYRRNEMISTLETSLEFWRIVKDESVEAAKAYAIFSFALVKAKKALMTSETSNGVLQQGSGEMLDVSRKAEQNIGGEWLSTDGFRPLPAFDWDLWNSQNVDVQDFESLFQWQTSAPGLESYQVQGFT